VKALLTILAALFCGFTAVEYAADWLGLVALPVAVAVGWWGLLRAWRFVTFRDGEW
jgi:hypothetical protein